MPAYYNEFDPEKAAWIRELMARGLVAPGDVDERSIALVQPDDLRGYNQCHFFAGIAVWSYALRRAGWPDDRPIWTGSCPCQPFSAAGKRKGTSDSRHLWPELFRLIAECRPGIVIGEQVSKAGGLRWLDGENPHMQEVRDREAVLGVLRELKGWQEVDMLRMLQETRPGPQKEKSGTDQRHIQGMAVKVPGGRAGECSEVSGGEAGHPVLPNAREYSGKNQEGVVRVDRDTIRPGNPTCMERAFDRSNCSWCGLYGGECPGGSLCGQYYGEHLGPPEDCGDLVGDFEAAQLGERSIELLACGEIEARNRKAWEQSVRHDLESSHYACGAISAPACGVGSPQIRERLYWLAHAEYSGRQGRNAFGGGPDPTLSHSEASRVDLTASQRWERGRSVEADGGPLEPERLRDAGGLVCADKECKRPAIDGTRDGDPSGRSQAGGFWARTDWVLTRGKRMGDPPSLRPVERRSFPLVDGAAARVGRRGDSGLPHEIEATAEARVMRLRGYGDAIVAPHAIEFIRAVMEVI